MHSPQIPPSAPASVPRTGSGALINGTLVMVLLYFGREVLVPITLAVILSLLIAPLVRVLKRHGFGQVWSVLGAVSGLTLCAVGLAVVIGLQMVALGASVPQYESTIRAKIKVVQEVTTGRMQIMQGEAGRMMSQLGESAGAPALAPTRPQAGIEGVHVTANGVVPVEIHERTPTPMEVMSRTFSQIWGPLGRAGIVLVILLFVLLEHDSLRDRCIRLVGGADLRGTTHAFNDAGERLSRFFVSQFAVNVGVGVIVGVGLAIVGLPHALLWAVVTAVLRFVPYVGVFVAAGSAALLAAAVDPGWSLTFLTLGLFGVVELIAAQVVEPQLYGHSTGLSPLSVVVSAIFWSWIWGPIGLLVSTPLTLCLVVAGRHVKGLAFLDILLGDTPALSMSERFYQRALSGDADEILIAAKAYLKRKSFARYCDKILMPALHLGIADLERHNISAQQQTVVKSTILRVVEALGPDVRKRSRGRRRVSVLDDESLGVQLRHQREAAIGKFQGPLEVAPGSVVLCIGLGSLRDDLVTELLVRILRDLDIDARHLSVEDVAHAPPPGTSTDGVAMVCVVSAIPAEEWPRAIEFIPRLRERYTAAVVVGLLPEDSAAVARDSVDIVVHSFEEASAHATALFERNKASAPAAP